MITLQSRGVEFPPTQHNDEGVDPKQPWDQDSIFDEMSDLLDIPLDPTDPGPMYLSTLTKEGVAFRQRFVAWMEAADGS